jgi:D-hydroxyproline dehydrogenase
VLLIDRAEPGTAGASYGNVGHIAAELVQPLPAPALLFSFWRQLTRFGGVLELSPRRMANPGPWMARFAAAAFRRGANTTQLAPLVLPAAADWEEGLRLAGQPQLLRRNGHYEVGFGPGAHARAHRQAAAMARLGIATAPVDAQLLEPMRRAAGAATAAGLLFEASAHIVDPLLAVRAFVTAALGRGAQFQRLDVRTIRPRGDRIEIAGGAGEAAINVQAAVICAGMGAQALLAQFGLHAPLQSVRGYHLEMPGAGAFLDAPLIYTDTHVLVTPMAGRLRASSFMEFAPADAPADAGKIAKLQARVLALGYPRAAPESAWVGSRPVLPDYLPGIGRAQGAANLFYAVGHQHIGLTLAPVTGTLIADLVAQRAPRHALHAFDLRRFGALQR